MRRNPEQPLNQAEGQRENEPDGEYEEGKGQVLKAQGGGRVGDLLPVVDPLFHLQVPLLPDVLV